MTKFYFIDSTIKKALSSLLTKMAAQQVASLHLAVLSGSILLPGGGYIGSKRAIVSLSSAKLTIQREDIQNESGYQYLLDADFTIQWLKHNRIKIPEDL